MQALRATIDFLLHDWLNTTELVQRERFADHSRETFDAVLDTCQRIARERFAPCNRLVDTQEPQFDGEKVILPEATHAAFKAFVESGMLSASQDYAMGGMQLPYSVEAAANAFFACASVSINPGLLTVGNANLLMAHGTAMQKQVFAKNALAGRWSGTMCLSEPQAGSSLSDINTRALPDGADYATDPLGPRFRLRGNKMWISAGEHELCENIIHLVLAKIPDASGKPIPGTRGISLFVVPKKLVDTEGVLTGVRNDVALAGLNHKLGWRGTTNTLLNFGEGKYPVDTTTQGGSAAGPWGQGAGAVGYLVGQPGDGLRCMFHMMNEARIGVGTTAAMLGMAGYYASLEYAKTRTQGRPVQKAGSPTLRTDATAVVAKDAEQAPVRIIEHADIKRMLLAQKSYCEGALALELYCARLVDEQHTAEAAQAGDARLLLEVLTPIAKSWPSEWCLEANSLAIQIHGGYGYTRDFPVEQYWRDNRLNMIHEGTHGIQALDLLGRKVLMQQGKGLQLLGQRIQATIDRANALPAPQDPGRNPNHNLDGPARDLGNAWQAVLHTTRQAWATAAPGEALANAVPYMQAFGHTVLAWIHLDVACAVWNAASDTADLDAPSRGRLAAMQFFFGYELPKIGAWLAVVARRDMTCADLDEAAF